MAYKICTLFKCTDLCDRIQMLSLWITLAKLIFRYLVYVNILSDDRYLNTQRHLNNARGGTAVLILRRNNALKY